MDTSPPPFLDGPALAALARSAPPAGSCSACGELVCPGWESLPGGYERSRLRRVGTLRREGDDDPTLAEHHPLGTHGWSADAPIAPAWFPYNRCDVWQCTACARLFLRYTEYGGYYEDERIRAVDARLIDDTQR